MIIVRILLLQGFGWGENIFQFLVYNESSATLIRVRIGICDNFEDTFTTCDKKEDTRVRLEKSGLILFF